MHQKQESDTKSICSDRKFACTSSKQKSRINVNKSISLKALMIATLAIVTIMMVVMGAIEAEGRYLPTRSDETRLETLKQLMRAVSKVCSRLIILFPKKKEILI